MAPHLLSRLSIPAWFRSTTWLSDPSPPRWPPWLASIVKGPGESLAVYVCPGCCAATRCDSLKLPPSNHILPPSLGNLWSAFYHYALVTLRMLYQWNRTVCKSLRLAFSTLHNAHGYLLLTCTHDPNSLHFIFFILDDVTRPPQRIQWLMPPWPVHGALVAWAGWPQGGSPGAAHLCRVPRGSGTMNGMDSSFCLPLLTISVL